uniref:Uncharacterized protein n=1 Tax=Cucumis melo TaxID=3656 RepID=A0A9I9EGA1_CUCME
MATNTAAKPMRTLESSACKSFITRLITQWRKRKISEKLKDLEKEKWVGMKQMQKQINGQKYTHKLMKCILV